MFSNPVRNYVEVTKTSLSYLVMADIIQAAIQDLANTSSIPDSTGALIIFNEIVSAAEDVKNLK